MRPGASVRWIAAGISRTPSEIIVPHEAFGACTPAPRYDSAASSRIAFARISGTNTMIVEDRFGRISVNMIRAGRRPCWRAASTNSRSRNVSTCARIGLAT